MNAGKSFLLTMALFFLCLASAEAKEVDWSAINPEFEGATFVKDAKVCAGCHEDYIKAYGKTKHGRTFKYGAKGDLQALDCEACHGPRSKHIENPSKSLGRDKMKPAQKAAICLQCHSGGSMMHWKSGKHQAAGVSCDSCHYVMDRRSANNLLIKEDAKSACYSCHADIRAKMLKNSRHPVREGKLDCSSCHNPHGSGNSMLKAASVNDVCYSCHAEKRGPFLWEHAPVRENCSTCHDPHGSNNQDLLKAKGAFQCTSCHQYGGHINEPRYNRVSTPTSKGCVNCHVSVHGSNHPSGAKLTR